MKQLGVLDYTFKYPENGWCCMVEIDITQAFKKKEEKIEKGKKEKVIAEYTCHHSHTQWMATDKGIIRIDKGLSAYSESFLPYSHISSVTLKKKNKHWLLALGGITGLAGIVITLLPSLFPTSLLSLFTDGFIYSIALALVLIVSGFVLNSTFYEFTGQGIHSKQWRMELYGKDTQEEMEEFIAAVEKKL